MGTHQVPHIKKKWQRFTHNKALGGKCYENQVHAWFCLMCALNSYNAFHVGFTYHYTPFKLPLPHVNSHVCKLPMWVG
jgi:hypothetical protein